MKRKANLIQTLGAVANGLVIVGVVAACAYYWTRGAVASLKRKNANAKPEHVPSVQMPQVHPEHYRSEPTIWN